MGHVIKKMYRGANSPKIAHKVLYYWNHNSSLLFFFFSQKVSFQWNPAEKICMPRGENIFHLYRHWNWICFTHNLLYIAAVINFKGSRIHFSNETMTILLLKSLNSPQRKHYIPHFLQSFYVYDFLDMGISETSHYQK